MKIINALCLAGAALCVALSPLLPVARAAEGALSVASGTHKRELRAIVRRLQRHYQSTDSFQAKFKEQITTTGGARRERKGEVSYRKPGRMRWDFAPPEKETIVSDGKTLYVYEPDLNQVVETPLERAFRSSAPSALLLGMGNLERDFTASLPSSASAGGLVHLSLKPKSDGSKVGLALDPRSYDIKTLTITDQLGNVTALDFSDIRTNVPLASSLFSFKVPDGVDIVTAPEAN